MKNKKEYTSKDCTFLLLAKLPNEKIHQVLIEQEKIQQLISDMKNFTVVGEVVQGIDFEIQK